MSYSNGKLPTDTHGKIIEIIKGLPGIGFNLTDDGDYDIENKKLKNVREGIDSDAVTKKYVDFEVSKTLKKDGTDKMDGLLDMNNSRIENVGPGRHGTTDALTHLQLEAFYFDLNTDNGKIEAQNPIDIKNQKISGLQDPLHYKAAATKFYIDNSVVLKADKTELNNYLKRDGSISVIGDFDFGNNKITKVGNGSQSTDLVNKGYIDTELAAKPNVNQVILRNGSQDMTGTLNMDNFKIINLAEGTDNSDAVTKHQLETGLVPKADKTELNNYLKRDGSISVIGDFDFGDNKITKVGNGSQSTDLMNKGYIDTELAAKPNVNEVILRNGSQKMTGTLNMNNFKITNVKDATHNQDALNLKQVNDGISTVSNQNNEYTDRKIAESHISTHENRDNVLKYAMDDGEFTIDFGIQDASLVTFNDIPHQTNKKSIQHGSSKNNRLFK